MKRFFALLLVFLSLAGTVYADTIDLSGMTYDELIALKAKINIAIWNSQEWQEVEVPQGVWKVGEDIPAGHWTVICADGWRNTEISWGQWLDDDGESISWSGRYSAWNNVYNPKHKYYEVDDGLTEYSFEVRNGEYIIVADGNCIFMPYAGKPDLGFKFK